METTTEQIVAAIERDDVEACRALIEGGLSVDERIDDESGSLPLVLAAKAGGAEIVDFLIEAGADVNLCDRRGWSSPLQWAASEEHLDICRALLAAGADINTADKEGDTPLINAARIGSEEVCRFLIERGADVNKGNEKGDTPLIAAIKDARLDVCSCLLHAGADANAATKDGDTALTCAARNDYYDLCGTLTDFGAEINVPAASGSPLCEAARNGNLALCNLLLALGADVNLLDRQKEMAALHAAAAAGAVDVCRFLVQHGASPSYMPAEPIDGYMTPMQQAVFHDSPDAFLYFLNECGEDPDQKTIDGMSLLEVAEESPNVRSLILSLRTKQVIEGAFDEGAVESVAGDAPSRRPARSSSFSI